MTRAYHTSDWEWRPEARMVVWRGPVLYAHRLAEGERRLLALVAGPRVRRRDRAAGRAFAWWAVARMARAAL